MLYGLPRYDESDECKATGAETGEVERSVGDGEGPIDKCYRGFSRLRVQPHVTVGFGWDFGKAGDIDATQI